MVYKTLHFCSPTDSAALVSDIVNVAPMTHSEDKYLLAFNDINQPVVTQAQAAKRGERTVERFSEMQRSNHQLALDRF